MHQGKNYENTPKCELVVEDDQDSKNRANSPSLIDEPTSPDYEYEEYRAGRKHAELDKVPHFHHSAFAPFISKTAFQSHFGGKGGDEKKSAILSYQEFLARYRTRGQAGKQLKD